MVVPFRVSRLLLIRPTHRRPPSYALFYVLLSLRCASRIDVAGAKTFVFVLFVSVRM